ncbi:MAG TPA: alpha/beta family hydrolase [Actinomycetota bacterium]|nr:alpha/beta family hydrolase [Actinomycetota bacterium]
MPTDEVRGEIHVPDLDVAVSTARSTPRGAIATLVLAHGAGAGMDHPFLAGFCRAIAEARVATVRFNFPYVERGRRAPDREPALRATWTAVVDAVGTEAPARPVLVGGKSLGGRIASMCVAEGMAADALVFLGYPLHPPGKPDRLRAEHLERIRVPMLFVEGTRDPFAQPDRLDVVLALLGALATLERVEGGDHSFRVPGPKVDDAVIGATLASVVAPFVRRVAGRGA